MIKSGVYSFSLSPSSVVFGFYFFAYARRIQGSLATVLLSMTVAYFYLFFPTPPFLLTCSFSSEQKIFDPRSLIEDLPPP